METPTGSLKAIFAHSKVSYGGSSSLGENSSSERLTAGRQAPLARGIACSRSSLDLRRTTYFRMLRAPGRLLSVAQLSPVSPLLHSAAPQLTWSSSWVTWGSGVDVLHPIWPSGATVCRARVLALQTNPQPPGLHVVAGPTESEVSRDKLNGVLAITSLIIWTLCL